MTELFLLALVESARAIITTYAVYAVVIGVAGVAFKIPVTWLELIEAAGGILWVVGVSWWRATPDSAGYDVDLFLRSTGVALMLLPRVMLIAKRAFTASVGGIIGRDERNCP